MARVTTADQVTVYEDGYGFYTTPVTGVTESIEAGAYDPVLWSAGVLANLGLHVACSGPGPSPKAMCTHEFPLSGLRCL